MSHHWKLHRIRALVGSVISRIDWAADLDSAATWRALAAEVAGTRLPPWVHRSPDMLAAALEGVADAIDAPEALLARAEHAYQEAADLWGDFDRFEDPPVWSGDLLLQPYDAGLDAKLGAVKAPGRPANIVTAGLLQAVKKELGRATPAVDDTVHKLAAKLLRRIARIQDQVVEANRLTLVWSVLVPLRASGSPADLERADKVLALFESGMPEGFGIPDAPEGLYGRKLLWPVVIETQTVDYKGLPYSSKAGRACWKVKDPKTRGDILIGIAQLATGRFRDGLLFPTSLDKGLTALAERVVEPELAFTPAQQVEMDACGQLPGWLLTHLEPVLLNTMGRTGEQPVALRGTRRERKTELEPEERGLRGGSLLWPIVEDILDDPSWVSWRSHPPSAEALLAAPKTYAGHLYTGIQQLRADPGRFSIPDHRQSDVNRVLGGFAYKRRRWMDEPELDDGDRAALAALPD